MTQCERLVHKVLDLLNQWKSCQSLTWHLTLLCDIYSANNHFDWMTLISYWEWTSHTESMYLEITSSWPKEGNGQGIVILHENRMLLNPMLNGNFIHSKEVLSIGCSFFSWISLFTIMLFILPNCNENTFSSRGATQLVDHLIMHSDLHPIQRKWCKRVLSGSHIKCLGAS